MDFREELLYEFLNQIREANRGATAASSLLSAIRFLHGVIKIKGLPKEVAFSARCEGLARGELGESDPQSSPRFLLRTRCGP